jgi:ZIP family zinc transporter
MGSIKDTTLGIKLAIAIMLHNIPEGISIAVPIYYSTRSKKKAVYNTLLSGLAEPIGAILAYLILNRYVNDLMLSVTLLLVAGIMITLSIQEMLPKALKYHKNKYIYIGLVIGTILIIINQIIL